MKLKWVEFETENDWLLTKEEIREAIPYIEDEFVDNFFTLYDKDGCKKIKSYL
jgi:hypothetical protein